jgi:hypothetical protein
MRDKTGVNNRFIEMIRSADKVVCLDANLHETTMDLIDDIRGETGKLIWNNHKTYGDVNVTIRKFKRNGIDHLIKLFE